MNPVRLQIIRDGTVSPPRLSHALPVALHNIVPEGSYSDFCNKINSLLCLAAADNKIRANSSIWLKCGIACLSLGISVCLIGAIWYMDKLSNSMLFFYMGITVLIASYIHEATIRVWIESATGVTTASRILREIREECDTMSNRTPHASFHVVLSTFGTTAIRNKQLHVNPIACIAVNLSGIGFEIARTNVGAISTEIHDAIRINTATITTSPVTNDYQPLHIV